MAQLTLGLQFQNDTVYHGRGVDGGSNIKLSTLHRLSGSRAGEQEVGLGYKVSGPSFNDSSSSKTPSPKGSVDFPNNQAATQYPNIRAY